MDFITVQANQLPPYSPGKKRPSTWTTPTPAIHQPPPLVSAILSVIVLYLLPRYLLAPGFTRRMPAYTTVSHVLSLSHWSPWPTPSYLSATWGLPVSGSPPISMEPYPSHWLSSPVYLQTVLRRFADLPTVSTRPHAPLILVPPTLPPCVLLKLLVSFGSWCLHWVTVFAR